MSHHIAILSCYAVVIIILFYSISYNFMCRVKLISFWINIKCNYNYKLKKYTYQIENYFTILFMLSVLFSFSRLALGQEYQYNFKQLTTKQNLTSQNSNLFIYQDSKGFIWISSVDGLNRYDGKQVKQYLPNRTGKQTLKTPEVFESFL